MILDRHKIDYIYNQILLILSESESYTSSNDAGIGSFSTAKYSNGGISYTLKIESKKDVIRKIILTGFERNLYSSSDKIVGNVELTAEDIGEEKIKDIRSKISESILRIDNKRFLGLFPEYSSKDTQRDLKISQLFQSGDVVIDRKEGIWKRITSGLF